ncbi:MAG: D-alanine--D-alanine ligase, partial [Patescibacteria group bacterium]
SGNKKSNDTDNPCREIPANINEDLKRQVENFGKQTYRILGCSGIARVDFLIDGNSQKVFVNEVNTLPGSLYCHNWRKMGVSGVDLVIKLVALAEERFQKQKNITYTFHSDILN